MKHFMRMPMIALILGLAGCAVFSTPTPAAPSASYGVAKAALTVYRDGFQEPVYEYGKLPTCGSEAATAALACKDGSVFLKLQKIDAATTAAIVAGNKAMHVAHGELSSVIGMMSAIADAEAKIVALGIKPKTQ